MRGPSVDSLLEQLSERDLAVLASLERFRLLTTGHLQRLHFADHASDLASARACTRSLRRLEEHELVSSLARRIGGVRRGSASYVWQLAAVGERLLRSLRGQARRRRFVEPGGTFVAHTLAVNDVAVALLEAGRTGQGLTVERLATEPGNWRQYLGPGSETRWLKPDLHVVLVIADDDGEYEEHLFLEIDLGTEHLPRIRDKCATYAAYAATGAYQADHGLFPAVVWLSPDPARRKALAAAVTGTPGLPEGAFRVAGPGAYVAGLGGAN